MSKNVYILGPQYSPFVRAVALCCEEKKIAYSIGFEPFNDTIKVGSEQHLALHPFGKGPVLIHNEYHLFETAPICRYLDNQFHGVDLQPHSAHQQAQVDQWCSAISTYIYNVLIKHYLLEFTFPKGEKGEIRWQVIEQAMTNIENVFHIIHHQLGKQEYFCTNQYTIADALLTPILDYLEKLPHACELFQRYPNLQRYVARMRSRESAKKVLTDITLPAPSAA